MKKNKMMRLASSLMVAVLLTTSMISGTFAKYTTSASSTDKARVANWGFEKDTVVEFPLFDSTYGNVAYVSENGEPTDLIAPGTEKKDIKFSIVNAENGKAPEVAYNFVVSTEGSKCATSIQENKNIRWYLDGALAGGTGTWEDFTKAIENLDGNKTYAPGEFPTEFTSGKTHTVGWKWLFTTADDPATTDINEMDVQDGIDTAMGNAAELAQVELVIKVTATQID